MAEDDASTEEAGAETTTPGGSPLLQKTRPVEAAEEIDPDERIRLAEEELAANEALEPGDSEETEEAPGRSKRWIFWLFAILVAAAVGAFFLIRQVNAGATPPPAPIEDVAVTRESVVTEPPPESTPLPNAEPAGNGEEPPEEATPPATREPQVAGVTDATPPATPVDPELDQQFREELQRVEELLEASPLAEAPDGEGTETDDTPDGEGPSSGSTQGGSDEPER